MSAGPGPARRRWGLRLGAGLALLAVSVAIVAAVLVTGSSPSRSAASPVASGSVTVERRNLVVTDTESGTIGYSNPQTVYDRLTGTITWLPQVGQRIGRGQALFRVDGQPVPLLYGSTPAFRSLSPDDPPGPDIEALNRNLIALGFNPGGIVDDDIWQTATTLGVEQFQAALGEPETGVLELGQVVFLPGVQLVAALDGSVGSTGGGGGGAAGASSGSAGSAAATSTPADPPRSEFVGLVLGRDRTGHGPARHPTARTPRPDRRTSPSHASRPQPKVGERREGPSVSARELAALTALLKAETAQLRAQSAALRAAKTAARSSHHASSTGTGHSSSSSSASTGGSSDASGDPTGGASPTAVLETTSPRLVVTVDLPASAQSEAQVGEGVTVELPTGNTVRGTITAVSRIAVSSSGSGSGTGGGSGGGSAGSGPGSGSSGATSSVPVTISLHGHLHAAGLDQAAVSVNFAQQRANNVLSVPVTALLAVPGGNYVLQEAAPPHRMIPVQTGLFAAGYVQVMGSGLYPGLSVTASQG